MQSTIIELRVSPSFERSHLRGVLARLRIPHESSKPAEIYARPYQAMDWMELEPETELKDIKPCLVDSGRARALIKMLRDIRLSPLVAPGAFGIHDTTYRLRVFSSATSCEYNWSHEPPPEWQALAGVASEVQSMAQEVLGAA